MMRIRSRWVGDALTLLSFLQLRVLLTPPPLLAPPTHLDTPTRIDQAALSTSPPAALVSRIVTPAADYPSPDYDLTRQG